MTVMCTNDEHPVSPSLLESMQLVFVLEDAGIGLKLLAFLGPVDESFFIEALD